MLNTLAFFFSFYILLVSVIGYGIFFQKIIYADGDDSNEIAIYIGFYGLSFITLISLISSIFFPHNFIHNIIVHSIGIFFLVFLKFKDKEKYLRDIIIISFFFLLSLLISKTHDDFSYYHLPFTKYLTEHKIIFGMGNLNHGYNFISSLFFLNSTFYIPFINYFSFHFSMVYFLIFFNFFLIKEIISKKNNNLIIYLYLFSFVYFNLSFNRLAEFGTDKVGQLLIVVLIIKLMQLVYFQNNIKKIENILYLIPLLAFCITLKTYFLPYILLSVTIFFYQTNILKILQRILLSKSFIIFNLFLGFYFLHHFISTGCVISPIPFTCFENYDWARETNQIAKINLWLEQWSKAGATPNFRVDNPSEYIQYLNWFPNWVDKYFFSKFLDQIALLFFSFIFIFFIFKNSKKQNITNNLLRFLPFYTIILFIFFIWFFKHPTLRYGGYSIFFLVFSLPISIFFSRYFYKDNFRKRFLILITIVFFSINLKNSIRIYKEINRTDQYSFKNFPFFAIQKNKFTQKNFKENFIIYSVISGDNHCWASPTPCGSINNNIFVHKKNGYFFINKIK